MFQEGFGEVKGSAVLIQQILQIFYQIQQLQYQLQILLLKKDDGKIDFQRFRAINNQQGVMGGIAQKIPIPADLPNSRGPWKEIGNWYRKQHIGRNNL
ncbi:8333_t:CDS:2 [Funneliformis mosseae]|uniref:8333_t:CDS:1 n=1 Tax=Funneliformis mosseae TaxID=27381 RepID=A0A9N9B5Z9_FUNMO|nr:8333_t:CDS:2 [Funneliformis mosseae]